MSITWGNRIVADPIFQSLSGVEAAGAHALRFSTAFVVANWPDEEKAPLIGLSAATVSVEASGRSLLMGHAAPETTIPFNVGQYGHSRGLVYEFIATPSCMEAIERLRDGTGVNFRLKVNAWLMIGDVVQPAQEELLCRVSQSDWLSVLGACELSEDAIARGSNAACRA